MSPNYRHFKESLNGQTFKAVGLVDHGVRYVPHSFTYLLTDNEHVAFYLQGTLNETVHSRQSAVQISPSI